MPSNKASKKSPDSSVTIAPGRFPEDKAALAQMLREYEQHLGINLCFQSFEEEIAALPYHYVPPLGGVLLARDGEKIAGSICWYPFDEGIAEIKRFFVNDGYRGTGLGRRLMEQALEEIRALEYHTVYLDSLKRLGPAEKLYRAFGFEDIPSYNGKHLEDVYHMQLRLAGNERTDSND